MLLRLSDCCYCYELGGLKVVFGYGDVVVRWWSCCYDVGKWKLGEKLGLIYDRCYVLL